MDVSIDTTHFRLTSRRHGWNRSQNASDRKGLLSFGCILEQLELLEMLESHIERLERLEKRLETSRHYRKIGDFHPSPLGAEDFLFYLGRLSNF